MGSIAWEPPRGFATASRALPGDEFGKALSHLLIDMAIRFAERCWTASLHDGKQDAIHFCSDLPGFGYRLRANGERVRGCSRGGVCW